MTRWFESLPVHQKLVAMALVVTTGALVAATSGLIALDAWRYRVEATNDVVSLAGIIAENSAAAVAFEDLEAAYETLETIRVRPTITRACIYRWDDNLLAGYNRESTRPCEATMPQPNNRRRVATQSPIMRNDRQLGTVFVERELSDLGSRIIVTAGAGLLMLLISASFAYAVAHRMHRTVSEPIAQLAMAARDVGSPSYAMPAIQANHDEIGELVRSFTAMVHRVREANEGLLKEIEERRRVEAERELLLVREREAGRVKDEFLAAVSHELRTPLNAIVGWVQILQMGHTDPETMSRAVSTIERNARAQARVIEDLLDVSRIITGKLHLEFKPVDLRAPVEGAVEVVRPAARARDIALDVRLHDCECMVKGDPLRLQQIVANLLSNAVKFSRAGGTVRVTVDGAPGGCVVSVADEGEGIPSEFLPHVFDRFRQSDGSMTREHGGLGLGLAIVKELTELHGGAVSAESDGLGTGATFTVTLPELPAAESALRPAPDPSGETPAPGLDGITVLAVDDNADSLDVLAIALRDAGASVKAASSPDEALTRWRQEPSDVVICDLAMPQMSGFELLRQLRHYETTRGRSEEIHAIALSAYASQDYVERCRAAGFARHLAKPFSTIELLRTVAFVAGRVTS